MTSSLDVPGVSARERARSARGQGRLPWALGGLTALLLLAGCGEQSSSGPSTRSAASVSPRPAATGASTTQPTVSSSVGATTTVTGSSGEVTATLRAGTHHPRVGRPWPIHFTVSSGGRPVRATVSYEYLLGSQVVARRDHYHFTGGFADVFRWPAAAVGYLLTFRAVIVADGTTLDLDYPVQVVG